MFKEEQEIVVGNIAGCLELIGAVLTIKNMVENSEHNFQSCTELLYGLTLYEDIKKLIGSKNTLYQYKIPLNIPTPRMQKPHP